MGVLSTVPVALVCDLDRMVVTAEPFLIVDRPTVDVFFHDFASSTVMPLAIEDAPLALPSTAQMNPITRLSAGLHLESYTEYFQDPPKSDVRADGRNALRASFAPMQKMCCLPRI